MNKYVAGTLIGIALGAAYVLSPAAVWFAAAIYGIYRYAISGLDPDDRRWVSALLALAVVLRAAAVAGLFVTTDHSQVVFGTFFGDEQFYLRRSIWLANVAQHIPTHTADFIYAFDESGWTSHLYVLAFMQALFGPSPYGAHLLGIAAYLLGAVIMYRAIRPTFGRAPGLAGLGLILFLPSLFAWSISALKEPLYLLFSACAVSWSLAIVRSRRWSMRLLALVGVAAVLVILQTVREEGGVLVGSGLAAGFFIGWIVARPRLLIAAMVATPILIGAVLSRPQNQFTAYTTIQKAARQHWGHVETPGIVYTLLEPRFYNDVSSISDMQFVDTMRFLVRAFWHYFTVPLPWEARSRDAVAEIPEQVVWYLLVLLLPIGLVCAFQRDAVLTGLLFGPALASIVAIALNSGNVGTLVRHRSLAIPYVLWLSLTGLCELLYRARLRGSAPAFTKAEPVWR